MLLSQFLQQTKFALRNKTAQVSRLTLVSGNQSADLDSVVSAIAYAFLHNSAHQSPSTLTVPLLNIPREDLPLRRDVEFVIKQANISSSDLFFLDDLATIPESISLDLVLVDHNDPQGKAVRTLFSRQNGSKVASIVDHHNDEGLYEDASPRIITKAGSCVSLVLQHFKEQLQLQLQDPVLARFFVAPILVDTSNLTQRVEPVDTAAVQLLQSGVASLSADSRQEYFQEIQAAKEDVHGLSLRDLLRKDYKEFNFGSLTIGCSSMVKPLEYLQREFDDISKGLEQWKQERNLHLAVVMTSFVDEKGNFSRELGFHTDKRDLLDSVVSFVSEPLQLEPLIIEGLQAYHQKNIKASRKQVAPLLKKFAESI